MAKAEVILVGNASQAVPEILRVQKAALDAGISLDDLRVTFKHTGEAASEAGKSHEGFAAKLRALKAEEVSAGRQARFFSNEIVSVIPGADGSAKALGGLLKVGMAFTGGMGIGAGIETAKFVLEQFAEVVEEEQKRAAKLRAAYVDAIDKIADSLRSLRHGFDLTPVSKTAEVWRRAQEELDDLVRKDKEATAEAEATATRWKSVSEWIGAAGKGLAVFLSSDKFLWDKFDDLHLKTKQEALDRTEEIERRRKALEKSTADFNRAQSAEYVKSALAADIQIAASKAALTDKLSQIEAARIAKNKDYERRSQVRTDGLPVELEARTAQKLIDANNVEAREQRRRVLQDAAFDERELRLKATRDTMSEVSALRVEAELAAEKKYEQILRTQPGALREVLWAELQAIQVAAGKQIAIATRTAAEKNRIEALAAQERVAKLHETRGDNASIAAGNLAYGEGAGEALLRLRKQADADRLRTRESIASEQDKNAELLRIDRQYDRDRMKVMYPSLDNGMQTMVSGWKNALSGMLTGTESFAQGVKSIFASVWQGVVSGALDAIGRVVEKELEGVAASIIGIQTKHAAVVAAEAGETGAITAAAAAQVAANSAKKVSDISTATTAVGASAAAAGAKAAESVAPTPFVGPALAIAAMVAVVAAVLGLKSLISASGGYDIPSGVNPLVQAHEREMFLPRKLADPLREMLASGGGSGGNTFNFNGVTDASWWRTNQSQIVRTIREATRNGRL